MDYNWIKEHFPEYKTVKGKSWIVLDEHTYDLLKAAIDKEEQRAHKITEAHKRLCKLVGLDLAVFS